MAGILAIAQPGGLGGDDDETSAPGQVTSTTTTTAAESTTTTTAPAPDPTVDGSAETTTTIPGSGIGTSEPPTGGSDGIADTGSESMLGAGLVLGLVGLGLHRAAQRRPA